MAGQVNKWLSIVLVGYLFGQDGLTGSWNLVSNPGPGAARHPIHVATVEINHNAAEKTIEISCHIFTDDFETVLSRQFGVRANLSADKPGPRMDSLVSRYIRQRLQLTLDDKPLALQFIGAEKEDQATYTYLQVDGVAAVHKLDVTNTILHDLYDDQIEIIHVIVNGNRRSTKLDFPASRASFSF